MCSFLSFLVWVCILFCSQLKVVVCIFTFPFNRPFISVQSRSATHVITRLCSHHCFDCTLCPDKCRLCPNIASVNMLYFTSVCLVSFCAFVPENSSCAVDIFMFFSLFVLLQILTLACFMDCGLVVCALLNYLATFHWTDDLLFCHCVWLSFLVFVAFSLFSTCDLFFEISLFLVL